MIQILGPLVVN